MVRLTCALVLLLVFSSALQSAHGGTVWETGLPIILYNQTSVTLGFTLQASTSIQWPLNSPSVIIDGFNLTISPASGTFTATLMVWNPAASSGTLVGFTGATDTVPGDIVSISLSQVSVGTVYALIVSGATVATAYPSGGVVTLNFTSGSNQDVTLGFPQGGGGGIVNQVQQQLVSPLGAAMLLGAFAVVLLGAHVLSKEARYRHRRRP